MDSLVLKTHDQSPARAVLGTWLVKRRMRLDQMTDNGINLLPVFTRLGDSRPDILLSVMQVIPAHLINAGFKQGLKMLVDGFINQSCHQQFIDVEAHRMNVIKDQRMARLVIRALKVGLIADQRREQGLGQAPGVLKVGPKRLTSARRIDQGQAERPAVSPCRFLLRRSRLFIHFAIGKLRSSFCRLGLGKGLSHPLYPYGNFLKGKFV